MKTMFLIVLILLLFFSPDLFPLGGQDFPAIYCFTTPFVETPKQVGLVGPAVICLIGGLFLGMIIYSSLTINEEQPNLIDN